MRQYRLINDNCFSFLRGLPAHSVDLVVTDPPYEHVSGGESSRKFNGPNGAWSKDSYVRKKMSQFGKKQIFQFLDLTIPLMQKTNMYIFCSRLQLAHYFAYLNQHKKLKYDLLIWDKTGLDNAYGMKNSMFFSQDIEYVIRIYEAGEHLNKIWNAEHTHARSSWYLKRQKFPQPKGGSTRQLSRLLY